MLELSSEEEEEYGDILRKVAQGIEVEDTDIEDEGEEPGAANAAGMPTNLTRLNNKVWAWAACLFWSMVGIVEIRKPRCVWFQEATVSETLFRDLGG